MFGGILRRRKRTDDDGDDVKGHNKDNSFQSHGDLASILDDYISGSNSRPDPIKEIEKYRNEI